MHLGRFDTVPADAVERNEVLEPEATRPRVDRRSFLLCAISAAAGVGLTFALGGGLARTRSAAVPAGSGTGPMTAPAPGSVEWAIALLDADDQTLLQAAGDLERVVARYPADQRLVPTVRRLLDVVLRSHADIADLAGTCAVRSLWLLGQTSWVLTRRSEIEKADLPQMREEVLLLAEESARSRGR